MIPISITFRWNDNEVLPGVLRSALEAKWRAYSVREALKEVPFYSCPISGESIDTLLRRNCEGAFTGFGYSARLLSRVLEAS